MALNSQSSHAVSGTDASTAKSQDPASWRPDLSAKERANFLLKLVKNQLDDDKAEDIITINLEGKSEVADAMVIASGRSQRHVGALADKLSRELKAQGLGNISIEGMPACDWVLLDAGDVIIHLFRPEVRDFYNLERIWSPEALTEPKSALNS